MSCTGEAYTARHIGANAPTAGSGPLPQRNVVGELTGALSGQGGEILLAAAAAGQYTLQLPACNAVRLTIYDRTGHAHTVAAVLQDGRSCLTFSGAVGSYMELLAVPDGQSWELVGMM